MFSTKGPVINYREGGGGRGNTMGEGVGGWAGEVLPLPETMYSQTSITESSFI